MRNKSIRSVTIIVGMLISAITYAADKMPIKMQKKSSIPKY